MMLINYDRSRINFYLHAFFFTSSASSPPRSYKYPRASQFSNKHSSRNNSNLPPLLLIKTATQSSATIMDLDAVFRFFDKDGDGKISAAELMLCMSKSTGEELSPEEAEALMEMADTDGDGLLNLEEFKKLVEAEGEEERERDLRTAFKMYENEGEGCITPKSLKRMLSRLGSSTGIEECQSVICRFDLNGDGVLNFEEFRVMMMV